MGRVCAYVPGQPGSYGRGKMGDEREPVKVGAFGELAGLREHRQKRIKHWLSQSSDTLKGLEACLGWKQREGGMETDNDPKILSTVPKPSLFLYNAFVNSILI